jgi:hypothetical protein
MQDALALPLWLYFLPSGHARVQISNLSGLMKNSQEALLPGCFLKAISLSILVEKSCSVKQDFSGGDRHLISSLMFVQSIYYTKEFSTEI